MASNSSLQENGAKEQKLKYMSRDFIGHSRIGEVIVQIQPE